MWLGDTFSSAFPSMEMDCMYMSNMASRADSVFNFRIDAEDRALLDAVSEFDKLSRGDVLRRALRAYAAQLGVKVPKVEPKKRAAKK